MTLLKVSFTRHAVALLLSVTLSLPALFAQKVSQQVALVNGWNSVWLEVEPYYEVGDTALGGPSGTEVLLAGDSRIGQAKAPSDIFDNPAVVMIASPRPALGLAEFYSEEPSSIGGFNQAEWLQWDRTDVAGQNDLLAMPGNRAYLIKSTAAATVNLSGRAKFFRHTWTPDRYNLVGFGLSGSPTMEEFFGPSGATHPVAKIFTLESATGNWQRVSAGQAMVSGQAYWVFCSGPSRYQGPVSVDFDLAMRGTLDFSGPRDAVAISQGVSAEERDIEELVFTNLGSGSVAPTLDLIEVSGSGLELRAVTVATDRIGYEFGNIIDSTLGASGTSALNEDVAPGSSATLTLAAKRNWVAGDVGRTNLYRLATGDKSASFWLPISALKTDLFVAGGTLPGAGEAHHGLWVGEVVVDAVSSIVEDGGPIRKTAGKAPIRVLIHVSSGGAKLLSNVTVMQTRTADEAVPPVPVLVVDPARIPFFEGVKERNGKKVGIRFEAVAYDMPRKLDAASQDALLNDEAYPDLTEAGIADFLLARNGRPPSLAETYHFSWPMGGAAGPGQTLSADFTMDPFHRSNPFRHAFHKTQVRGTSIRRQMSITFDDEQTFADRLTGEFTETVSGLIQSNLQVKGRVKFQRVSPVGNLEGSN